MRDWHTFLLYLNRPRSSAGGEDAYPELEDKAAALAHGFIRSQAFVDGNKRTGILAGMVMLRANGRDPVATPDALYDVAKAVQSGSMSQDDLVLWMSDWNNVLPVLQDEWDENPRLFDYTEFLVVGEDEEE